MSTMENGSIGAAGLRQLRHDLLNPLNVLLGMTTVMLDSDLTDRQRTCMQACRNATERLLNIAQHLDAYQQHEHIDGPAQFADLCSIAAARVDKPFDRETLLGVVRRLSAGSSPRILLVDDAPDIAVLVQAYLKGTNATLDVVADGERAVAQACSQPYDLVLMDVDLPGLDGATAAHAIRAADLARGARPTPVVALSAMGNSITPPEDEPDLVVIDDEDTAPLIPAFLDNRREEVATMRSLLEQANFARVESIGHKLKGTGKSYGFAALSRIGGDVERAAHQHDAAAMERLINELDAYLSHVQVEIRPAPA
jgi:CheY-like chemotaxis protein